MNEECEFPDCARHPRSSGYCATHHGQLMRGKELAPIRPYTFRGKDAVCTFPDCGQPHKAYGYCGAHRRQFSSGEELRPVRVRGPRTGQGWVDGGYVKRYVNGKEVREHRWVMEQALGRPLLTTETVHHINGNGLDNRLENLQLRRGDHGQGAVFQCLDCHSHNIAATQITDAAWRTEEAA